MTAKQFPGDPMYPYVGKYITHLTLAQIKTLDCGSQRQNGYRKISSHKHKYTSKIDSFSVAIDISRDADIHTQGSI
jgi:hypothetical protein